VSGREFKYNPKVFGLSVLYTGGVILYPGYIIISIICVIYISGLISSIRYNGAESLSCKTSLMHIRRGSNRVYTIYLILTFVNDKFVWRMASISGREEEKVKMIMD
jgi:hypothetical protein